MPASTLPMTPSPFAGGGGGGAGTLTVVLTAAPLPTPLVAWTLTVSAPPPVHSGWPAQAMARVVEVPETVVEPETPPPDQLAT
ncbi:hypothetical protein [Georgenia sp. Marseille-Q6866]